MLFIVIYHFNVLLETSRLRQLAYTGIIGQMVRRAISTSTIQTIVPIMTAIPRYRRIQDVMSDSLLPSVICRIKFSLTAVRKMTTPKGNSNAIIAILCPASLLKKLKLFEFIPFHSRRIKHVMLERCY